MKKLIFVISMLVSSLVTAKEIEFTIMHGPGGVSDIVSRQLAKELPNYIPINRPGAGGQVAINHLLKNNSIMLATMAQVFATNPLNFKDLNHDPYTDLEVIATIGIMPSALVCNRKHQFKNYKDFKENKKPLTFGFGGYGSNEHLATETLLLKNNSINHIGVPYPLGGSTAVRDLLGGHIDCMFANFPTIKNYLINNEITLLMTTNDLDLNVDTWESIYEEKFPFQSYLSLIVSKKMDETSKETIRENLSKSFTKKDHILALKNLGLFVVVSTDKKFIQQSLDEMKKISNFIVTNKIKISN
jgi:tripartite-type tricarboxylate transporter receptor subunit TctC